MFMALRGDQLAPDGKALRPFLVLGAFFAVAVTGYYAYALDLTGPIPRDGSSLVVGRDFLNFWMYGRAAFTSEPGRWYDVVAYQRELATFLGADYPGQNWSYPPTIMLLMAPFGRLPYLPALLIWSIGGIAVFACALWRQYRDRTLLLALVLSPAAMFGLMSGQLALFVAAIVLGIFACLDRRPLLAGCLIALLSVKPQLALLFPVMLLAGGHWRAFFSAAVATLAIVAVTTLMFGPQVWIDYVMRALPTQNLVMTDAAGIATPFYPTVFMNLRGIGASYAVAMAVQIVVALAAVAAVTWGFKAHRHAARHVLLTLFTAASISALPYLLLYDTLPLAIATLAWLACEKLDTRGQVLARLVYWLPLIQIGLGTWHIPGAALIPPAMLAYAVVRLRAADQGQPTAIPAIQTS